MNGIRNQAEIKELARMLNITPAYLSRLLASGGAGYSLAIRLAKIVGCPPEVFLYGRPHESGGGPESGRGRAATSPATTLHLQGAKRGA
jgi:hypothetical protein